MGKLQRNKGARGERELALVLTEAGFPARRGQQFRGGPDSPDVVCDCLPIHWECKRVERLRIYDALDQARDEAGGNIPVVAHRKNNHDWIAVLRLADLLDILRESDLVRPVLLSGDDSKPHRSTSGRDHGHNSEK